MLTLNQINSLTPQNKQYLVRLDRSFTTESGIVLSRPQASPFQVFKVVSVPEVQEDGFSLKEHDEIVVPGTMFDGYVCLYSSDSVEYGLLRPSLVLGRFENEQ